MGKSTLINSVLKIDKAKEGKGMGITDGFYTYISEEEDNTLRLTDSKGFKDESTLSADIDRITNFIKGKLLSKDNDEYIHCIWYCFSGDRFNSEQINKHITKLREIYQDDHLPVILVQTKIFDKEDANENKEILEKSLNEVQRDNIIQVLAREYYKGAIPSFGLNELINKTKDKIRNSVNSSIYQSIRNRMIDSYKKDIDEKFNLIKNNIESNMENYQDFSYKNYENIFYGILKNFFFNGNENDFNIFINDDEEKKKKKKMI